MKNQHMSSSWRFSGSHENVRGGFPSGRWVLADFHVPFIFCPYDIIKSCSPISTLGGVLKSDFWYETILGRFSFFEKNHMGKLAFFSPLKSLHRRLILWKLKLFHFSSIKSSRRVISSFWCYRKFLLTPETILDTLDVCWNRLDDFFTLSSKN